MKESDLTTEVTSLLRSRFIWTHCCPDGPHTRAGGLPDIICINAPVVIEVKTFHKLGLEKDWAKTTFPFRAINPEQRAWLTMFDRDPQHESFLAIGTVHGRAGAKINPRMLWIIPWKVWLAMEGCILPHRKSLPLARYKGQRKAGQGLNAVELLSEYSLGHSSGMWELPATHKLWKFAKKRDPEKLAIFRKEWRELRTKLREQWE